MITLNDIKDAYNYLREAIARTINTINVIKNCENKNEILSKAELLKVYLKSLNVITTGRIDVLIREKRIDKKMVTTLLNDSSHAHNIIDKLIDVSKILWIDSNIEEIKEQIES